MKKKNAPTPTTALVDDSDVHALMIGAAGVGKTAFSLRVVDTFILHLTISLSFPGTNSYELLVLSKIEKRDLDHLFSAEKVLAIFDFAA